MKKICKKCNIAKETCEFSKQGSGKYRGKYLKSYCKKCCLPYSLTDASRLADRLFQQRKRKNNPGLKTLEARIYRKKNPEKAKAHQLLNRFVKKGLIPRENCEVCGGTHVHAHHPDYSKPLLVRWLCPMHHKQLHVGSIN